MADRLDPGFALLSRIEPGQSIAIEDDEPVTRRALALYAGGSGDHHPIHIDSDYARAHGLDDVIAHGMYTCARLLRMFTDHWPQQALRSCRVRFTAPVPPGARLSLRAVVQAATRTTTERQVTFDVELADRAGQSRFLRGEVVVACPSPSIPTNP